MNRILQVLTLACFLTASALGQEASAPSPAATSSAASASAEKKGPAPPRQIRFSGVVAKGNGAPASGDAVALTFALYETQLGESPLWTETQSVTLDAGGRYAVLLGATSNEGLPLALFVAGEARWIGVRVADGNSAEQPRVQLVSVPYALAAGDAQTLGGRPVSDFALSKAGRLASGQTAGGDGQAPGPVTSGPVQTIAGTTVNRIAKFTGVDIIGNSNVIDDGTNVISLVKLGIGATPTSLLSVNGSITQGTPSAFEAHLVRIDGTALSSGAGQAYLRALQIAPTYNTTAGYANYIIGAEVYLSNRVGGNIAHSMVNFHSGSTTAHNGSSCVVNFGIDVPNQQLSLCNGIYGFYENSSLATKNYLKNNLGIGTISPTEKLDVVGNVKASGNLVLPTTTSSTAGVITSAGSRFIHSFGTNNFFAGVNAGNFSLLGFGNTAVGVSSLLSNTSGFNNTASGHQALQNNTTGDSNAAHGVRALFSNTTGSGNSAIGDEALRNTTTGVSNTASGYVALQLNATGFNNTAAGAYALQNNTNSYNSALGTYALLSNTTGSDNTAVGESAMFANTTGTANVTVGSLSLDSNTIGNNNSSLGVGSLGSNTTGSNNTALGVEAGVTGTLANANTTGSSNTFLGYRSGPGTSTQLTNATAIGAAALVSASNSLVLGNNANVGIGTATPAQKLDVVGNALVSGSVTAGSFVGNGAGLTGLTGAQTGNVNTFTQTQNFNVTLNMATTTGASAGVITSGGSRFLHNYGTQNIFTGVNAGNFTMTGTGNTATGFASLTSNTTGGANTAHGLQTMISNTTGFNNTAMGGQVLLTNTSGGANTGTGAAALFGNTTGNSNTATGTQALLSNTSGSNNTAVGTQAGYTATPANANTTGSNNTFLGYRSGPGTSSPLSNATAIGANALVSQSNSIILGDGTVRVGMGTQTPSFQIDIQNTNAAAAGANLFRIQTPSVNGATMHFISTSANGRHWGFGSNFILGIGEFGIYDYTAAAARLWIDSAGNIGLGTNNPSQKLQVAGMVYSTSGGFKFPDGTTQTTAASGGGAGDITAVNAGDGLTGGGASGDVALQVSANVARKDINNNFAATQTITGSLLVSQNGSFGGTITKGAGSFKIDHPLDPAHKFLSHSFVESPDMKNVYDGVVVLDTQGEAWVQMPDYFEALNKDFRYQLTCVGSFAPVYIAEKVARNRFKIAGGRGGLEVSWQITGTRQDAYANAHRIPVEEKKTEQERGTFLHPELFAGPGAEAKLSEKALPLKHERQ